MAPIALAILVAVAVSLAGVAGSRSHGAGDGDPDEVAPGQTSWRLPDYPLLALSPPAGESPLYDAQVASFNELAPVSFEGCPEPSVVRGRGDWSSAVVAQWRCIHQGWVPELASRGLDTSEPPIHFFDGSAAASPCGWIEAPAFYCSGPGGGVWFGGGHLEMAKAWDLSVAEMVSHEYSHHLQFLYGITGVKVSAGGGVELDRRAELQATCLSGAMAMASVPFGADEYAGWAARLSMMLADEHHGTRDSMVYWGMRGLYAVTYGDCNTWVVGEEQVR